MISGKPKTPRAQLSLEFLLASIAILVMFTALMQVYADKQQTFFDSQQTMAAKAISNAIGREINAVAASANGTTSSVSFGNASSTLGGYTICANNSIVEVRWKNNGRFVSTPIISNRIFSQTGSSIVSCAPASAINATITNNNGDIYLE
ncbi:MAG: hypothetical protein WC792_00085 [Candidatus Micrarchaeia archaeon]|jgi:uncharacterized protein (UPF0333 family)